MPFRILLVHPSAAELERMEAVLARAGHLVETATTFADAKARLGVPPGPDLLIAAVKLAAFNGLHLIIQARAAWPGIATIITTAVADPALIAEARALGATCAVAPWENEAALLGLAGDSSRQV